MRDFFRNGGGEAIIVRLFNPVTAAHAAIDANGLQLRAGLTETFANVTTINSTRRIDNILKQQSALVRTASGALTAPSVHGDPTAPKTIWHDAIGDNEFKGTIPYGNPRPLPPRRIRLGVQDAALSRR